VISDTELAGLIAAIYEAGVDFGRWPNVLEHMAAAFDAPSAAMVRQGLTPSEAWAMASRLDPSFARDYIDHYHSVNPIWRRSASAPAGTIQTDSMIMPRPELARTEFFNDFLVPQECGGLLSAVALVEDGRQTVIAVHARREVQDEEIALYRLLTPHLRRAVDINVRLSAASINHSAAIGVVDRLDEGVLFVDESARVVFANPAAEALMDDAEAGLRRSGGVLQAAALSETAALHAAIARCAGPDHRRGAALSLSRGPDRSPLAVRVAPVVNNLPSWMTGRRPVAIITVSDPSRQAKPAARQLQDQFGLTRAQAALAIEILAGDGIQAAADRLGVTRATARTHLARIFEKTGANRQAELVHLLLAATPSLRPD